MTELALYADLLRDIKSRIRQAQTRATLSANAEMIRMYWDIGRMIHERQQEEGWGAGVIPRLAKDIRSDIPEVKGFSERNIGRMIAFYREYADYNPILPQPVAKLENGSKVPQPVAKIAPFLCQTKDRILAEYALRDIHKPIGVSDYELTRSLPENLKSSLPTIEEIEAELQSELGDEQNEP
jgi:hypothetical protein